MLKIKHTLKAIAICLCLILVSGNIAVFADTYTTTVHSQARGMVYTNQPTNGEPSGRFTLTTSSKVRKYTVQTQDFPSNSYITVAVFKDGKQVSETGAFLSGNEKYSNLSLIMPYTSGTYTIEWTVSNGGSGWIGVWLF